MRFLARYFFFVPPLLVLSSVCLAEENVANLFNLSLEQLMDIEVVTSASKYPQSILESPSAVTVITSEDIEKSGTLDMLELFRFVPGTLVVEENSNRAEVYIRGLPQTASGRLLVLVDGTPFYFSGDASINWRWLPVSLPNIERIEIIRGPSSTLYGANAFSGVINITSKEVKDQGSVSLRASGGNLQLNEEEIIWNRPVSDSVRFRASGKFRHDNGYGTNNGNSQFDSQTAGQGMLDVAWTLSPATRMKFFTYGRYLRDEEDIAIAQFGAKSNSLLGGFRLDHNLSDRQSLGFWTSYQRYNEDLEIPVPGLTITVHDINANLQYTNRFNERDTLVGGAAFRFARTRDLTFFTPPFRNLELASLFINNDFKIRDNLILTTGGRYEYDNITDNQLSGRANLTYLPWTDHAFRVSVARAVRTPSLNEAYHFRLNSPDFCCPFVLPIPSTQPGDIGGFIDNLGNPNLKPESVLAIELGYQGECFQKRFHPNIQLYVNDIRNLIFQELTNVDLVSAPPHAVSTWQNGGDIQLYGVETDLNYKIFDWWRTGLNYSYSRQVGNLPANAFNVRTGVFPRHLFNFKNRFVSRNGYSMELLFNYTGAYQFNDQGSTAAIGRFFRLDARLAKKFINHPFELAVVGQNLIDSGHDEKFGTRVDRRVYGTLIFSY